VLCSGGVQVLPEVSRVRFAEPAAAPKVEPETDQAPAAAGAAAADGAPGSSKAGARPGSSGGKKGSAASKGAKGKQQQQRRFYDTSSESDWTDSEVRRGFAFLSWLLLWGVLMG
jgi:hypothetical protein